MFTFPSQRPGWDFSGAVAANGGDRTRSDRMVAALAGMEKLLVELDALGLEFAAAHLASAMDMVRCSRSAKG